MLLVTPVTAHRFSFGKNAVSLENLMPPSEHLHILDLDEKFTNCVEVLGMRGNVA